MVSKIHSHGCHKTMPHLKTIFKTNYALLKTVFIIIVIPNFQSKHACNKNFKTSVKIKKISANTTCYQAPRSLRAPNGVVAVEKKSAEPSVAPKQQQQEEERKSFGKMFLKSELIKLERKKWQNRLTQEKLKNLYLHLCQQVGGQEVIRFLKRMLRTKL